MMFSEVAKANDMIGEVKEIDQNIKLIDDHPKAELSVIMEWPVDATENSHAESAVIAGIELRHIRDALVARKVAMTSHLRNMDIIPDGTASAGWPMVREWNGSKPDKWVSASRDEQTEVSGAKWDSTTREWESVSRDRQDSAK